MKKSIKATENHLMNIAYLSENPNPSKEKLEKMYSYLNYCWICGKRITLFNRLFNMQHSFEGNAHKRCPKLKKFVKVSSDDLKQEDGERK